MSDTGDINGYRCDACGRHTYIVHVDKGVTPMFLACRAEGIDPCKAECKGTGTSLMYPPPPFPRHVRVAVAWEWYRPGRRELARESEGVREHVALGGVSLRPLTDAGRAALDGER